MTERQISEVLKGLQPEGTSVNHDPMAIIITRRNLPVPGCSCGQLDTCNLCYSAKGYTCQDEPLPRCRSCKKFVTDEDNFCSDCGYPSDAAIDRFTHSGIE